MASKSTLSSKAPPTPPTLTYVSQTSSVDSSFWAKLAELKLNVFKASEATSDIWGYIRLLEYPNVNSTLVELDSSSFNKLSSSQETYLPIHGRLINMPYVDKFKDCDKELLINLEGMRLVQEIKNKNSLRNPSILNWFILLTYSDIKKYQFYYWFAFPVPKRVVIEKISSQNIVDTFTKDMITHLYKEFKKLDKNQRSYFVVIKKANVLTVTSIYDAVQNNLMQTECEGFFVFLNLAQSGNVCSQLRTYIAYLHYHFPDLAGKIVNFIALNLSREKAEITLNKSTIYKLKFPQETELDLSYWVGWEKNERDNYGPRLANMKKTLDPKFLAQLSEDLNLNLMKWNLVPNLDLEKIKYAKCLLLGAGTLGCSVARTLVGWGVRNISFVDNGTVSTSNPVRQSLYTYQDAVASKPKAQAAADAIRLITPNANTKGYKFNIPMPGHPPGESLIAQTEANLNLLIDLIEKHDIIFLLLDSRESRWLPTVIGSSKKKIIINAALGFDSFLVMRHGVHIDEPILEANQDCPVGFKKVDGRRLGCYFCTDIVAPNNSMKNRTLDQQCTVVRPGVSQIAGALAAELAISVFIHEDGVAAPAYYIAKQNVKDLDIQELKPCELGLVPHSIRGFLSSYEQFWPATEKYSNCVACSNAIITYFRERKMKFVLEVLNDPTTLEGIAKVPKMADFMNKQIYNDVYPEDEEFADWTIS